ncbi:ATP-binding protein [Streptomyces sp. NBC_01538]|uniref:ATP-binding protein n=1 Tax=Streptomyces sp. NBC_01538 TaxID=2903897 RepID=UPI00386C000C
MREHASQPRGRRRRTRSATTGASALAAAAVGSAWISDGLNLLPPAVAGAAAVTAASGVVWWTALQSRSARQAASETRQGLEERDRAMEALRSIAVEVEQGRQSIAWATAAVRRGDLETGHAPPVAPSTSGDLSTDVVEALRYAQAEAWQAVLAAAAHQHQLLNGQAELAEIFSSIAPRLQALVNRTIVVISAIEKSVEDPDLMHKLFGVDHLATQMRRAVESLAVLGGSTPTRDADPVLVATALRQAVQEIPDYQRVRVVIPKQLLALPGYASPNVVHLLAELMENATKWSSTRVEVHTTLVPGGLAIEVLDRGAGISDQKRAALNQLLKAPETADPRGRLREGQIGLLVAALLARRHKIDIYLRPNVMGGTHAIVVLPDELLVTTKDNQPSAGRIAGPSPRPDSQSVGPRPSAPVVGRAHSGLPRRLTQSRPQANGHQGVSVEAGSDPSNGAKPALPRRTAAHRGPEPPTQQGPSGLPTSDLMAQFTSRTGSDRPAR